MNALSVCGWTLAAAALAQGTGALVQKNAPTHDDVAAVETFLFVQNANSGAYDGTRLTLHAVAPTVFFSDRPYRVFGHVDAQAFIEAWKRGPNSFATDPPNAILSLLGEEHVDGIMVELSDPRLEAGDLSYAVTVQDGKVPATFEAASLFIDNEAWAAVGGLAAGHILTRRSDERARAAYAAGAASNPVVVQQTPTYYYNASAPSVPPPPPPPPGQASGPSVPALLSQAIAEMQAYARQKGGQDASYVQNLVSTLESVSSDYAKVAH